MEKSQNKGYKEKFPQTEEKYELFVENAPQEPLVLQKDNSLFLIQTDGSFRKLIDIQSQHINSYEYSIKNRSVVYELSEEPGIAYHVDTESLDIQKIDLSKENIFPERGLHLSFSPRDEKGNIFIAATRKLWRYNTTDKTLNRIYSDYSKKADPVKDPYGMSYPFFNSIRVSPSGRELLVGEGGHEGGKYFTYDLASNRLQYLPFESNLHSTYVFAQWKNDDTLIMNENHDDENINPDLRNTAIISLFSLENQQKTEIVRFDGYFANLWVTDDAILGLSDEGIIHYDRQDNTLKNIWPQDPTGLRQVTGIFIREEQSELFAFTTENQLWSSDLDEGNHGFKLITK